MHGADAAMLTSRLRLAVVRLNRRLRAQRLSDELSLSQVSALATLYKCGELSPSELAERESVRPPSMTRVIAALEDRGYLTRRAHPRDGRQAIVAITESGAEYMAANISARERWLEQRLAELDEAERRILALAADIIDRIAGR